MGIAASLCAASFAQNPAAKSVPATAAIRARVEHVIVRGTGDAMEVEIQTSGAPVAPDTQAITGPDRIVVDFPGALPAAELRALNVNRGALKSVRSGLFFNNPPITRVVLDLAEPQSYKISPTVNGVVVKLGSGKAVLGTTAARAVAPTALPRHGVNLQNALLIAKTPVASAIPLQATVVAPAVASVLPAGPNPVVSEPAPPKPLVMVNFADGMLRIRADHATLAQVLFEVHHQTQAEIAIPAGAEQEEVFADLGPAPPRDVLASLLNGSSYNFIFIGGEQTLEQVILTRRDPNLF